ncbi:hypothetical protein EKO24_006970 [Candidatus Methylobacter oryzae]|uniref:Uncharacterized protein n=1 Tax=Candidatus Methylobacter oryzae TaxID=2497749 RepID=A0ABY3CCD3_9GAMM|nr:hypothetical protein EKO24_006970 [Candidatus Methylobacter oryzae]
MSIMKRLSCRYTNLPGFATAMDGGSVAIGTTARDAGGTTPRMGEVESRLEQRSRATQERLPRELMLPTAMDGGRERLQ